jgi:hypothetical protein
MKAMQFMGSLAGSLFCKWIALTMTMARPPEDATKPISLGRMLPRGFFNTQIQPSVEEREYVWILEVV